MIPPLLFLAMSGLAYAVVSARLSRSVLTAPIFFAGLGLLAGPVLGLVDLNPGDDLLIRLLEAALGMLLFADACALDPGRFRREYWLSTRLLLIGMPLTIVVGALAALLVWPGIPLWQAALLATVLAATDAALGHAVVANPRVPAVVRNALSVEGGANDGLALPILSILVAIGLISGGLETELQAFLILLTGLLGSVAIGVLAGVGGGWLVRHAARRGLVTKEWQSIALVAIAVIAYVGAYRVEASGFLAIWIAGLAVGRIARPALASDAFDLSEGIANSLVAVGFVLLGTALLGPVLARATWQSIGYAVLSLTVVRLLPVGIAMVRSGFAWATVLYVGWFGPRGLPSVVFASVIVAREVPAATAISDVALTTVALSIVAHGATAAWGARRYAAWFEAAVVARPDLPEGAEVPEGAVFRRESLEGRRGAE